MDFTKESPLTSISIGPGIRGIERGVERITRLNHLLYVEIEAFIIENLVAEMEAGILAPAAIWSDAKTCRWEIFRGLVDILFAGYPCQPFSTAGRRRGTEDPRHLYPYIEKAVDIIRPRICFFENVRGHVTCGLAEVIASLEGLGYRVHWGVFSAEETGATHKRERVFILAILANSRLFGSQERQFKTSGIEKCGELGNANVQPINSSIRWIRRESHPTSKSVGYTTSINERDERVIKEGFKESPGGSGDVQKLGNSNDSGLQGRISGKREECAGKRLTRANGPFARVSRPGQSQQTWEHPRIISREIESAVGLSTHGYNFREDVLRALGNSVYADTSDLAFRTLLMKFL